MASPIHEILVTILGATAEQVVEAETVVAAGGQTLIGALEAMGFKEDKLLEAFSKIHRLPKAHLGDMEIQRPIIDLIPKELAMKYRVVTIDRAGNNIIVAMAEPKIETLDTIRFKSGYFPKPVLAVESRISEAITKYYGKTNFDFASANDMATNAGVVVAKTGQQERQQISKVDKSDGPIIKLVNWMLMECKGRGASDIHIEPYESFIRIRLRIDGVLHEIARPHASMRAPLTSRVKIMSNLDIAETRLPQDGAINIRIHDSDIDFRVSCLPTVYGEKIVMRILDKSNLQVDMTKLGFERDEMDKFVKSIHSPFGMVLVTGPTGSGKTTTLYSAIADLNRESENIMTAEDPVEYNLEGINQVQMKSDIGLNFAAALKSFLRQDPDIIMVGEIRDLETAEIAIKAALTGHMVLSTLHTNSAPDTISRLLNMGVEGFNLVSALTCITAQRLLRRICQKCKIVDDSVTPEALIDLGIHENFVGRIKAYKGAGCNACNKTGNKGRIACHEVLKLNDPVREAILKNLPAMEIKKIAMATGMRSLRQSALVKMVQGQTSALEVVRATAADSEGADKAAAA